MRNCFVPPLETSLRLRKIRQGVSPFCRIICALKRQRSFEIPLRFLKCCGVECAPACQYQIADQSLPLAKDFALSRWSAISLACWLTAPRPDSRPNTRRGRSRRSRPGAGRCEAPDTSKVPAWTRRPNEGPQAGTWSAVFEPPGPAPRKALEKIAALLRSRKFQRFRKIGKNSPKAWRDLSHFRCVEPHLPTVVIEARRLARDYFR